MRQAEYRGAESIGTKYTRVNKKHQGIDHICVPDLKI